MPVRDQRVHQAARHAIVGAHERIAAHRGGRVASCAPRTAAENVGAAVRVERIVIAGDARLHRRRLVLLAQEPDPRAPSRSRCSVAR